MRLKTILGLLVLTACVCLLFFILLHREAIHDAPVRRSDCTLCGPVKTTGLQKAAILALDESKPTVPTGDALVDFDDWSGRYLQAGADQRAALVGEGAQRARERRPIYKQLIIDDPRAAIERAVPMVLRQKLPVEIVSLLERRMNKRAAVTVSLIQFVASRAVAPMPAVAVASMAEKKAPCRVREVEGRELGAFRLHSTPAAARKGG